MRYGQTYYDFDAGTMTFIAPGQVLSAVNPQQTEMTGWWLSVHPDFLRPYPLGTRIADYGYFSYATNEALHLSDKEDEMLAQLVAVLIKECASGIDAFTQDIVVTQIELLLNYCNRFYNRQFITRKAASADLLVRLEGLLEAHFNSLSATHTGLPTVQELAAGLSLSPGYLGDMLRSLTGMNAQQHIHNWIIERSKNLLATTSLSVGEIAYRLGFSYPQSFNKLFRNKTSQSPLEYRQSLS
jgi:AraC-like DNA-binding protein